MKILFYDRVQDSNAPAELKSAALADKWVGSSITITLNSSHLINSIGIGYTDATQFVVNGETVSFDENGLYDLLEQNSSSVVITHDGSFVGRIAIGYGHFLGNSKAREPKFKTSSTSRFTRSGQPIPGAGGISWREIDVDCRYKVTREIFQDIQDAYPEQISRNYPFFISFGKEYHRFPWLRFYGASDPSMVFQSSVNRFSYSKKFSFREAF